MVQSTQVEVTQASLFEDPISRFFDLKEELKIQTGMKKDLENNFTMELEDLILSLNDLKKQVKEKKDEFIRGLMEENQDYNSARERIQEIKESLANIKLGLSTQVNSAPNSDGLDLTVKTGNGPVRLQTQKQISIYLNGKELK